MKEDTALEITLYGTRGSSPVSGPDSLRYGGNTTCLRVETNCLPSDQWLVIDMGSGMLPLSRDFMKAGGKKLTVFSTHPHHDHTQGFPLTPFPFLKDLPVDIYGPYEHGEGPRETLRDIMKPPRFPVHFDECGSHIYCHNVEFPNSTIIVIHPTGGVIMMNSERFERALGGSGQIPFAKGHRYPVRDCMVVKLHKSNHPEQTISYRFEDNVTGESFVFLTDHENQSSTPARLKQHLRGADLGIFDCQYTRQKYDAMAAGWGHSTPDYVASIAAEAGIKQVGLTHHDPWSPDDLIDEIVGTATELLPGAEVFGCRDYMKVAVGLPLALTA